MIDVDLVGLWHHQINIDHEKSAVGCGLTKPSSSNRLRPLSGSASSVYDQVMTERSDRTPAAASGGSAGSGGAADNGGSAGSRGVGGQQQVGGQQRVGRG